MMMPSNQFLFMNYLLYYVFSNESDENIVAHIKDIIVSFISVMGIIDAVADAIDAIADAIDAVADAIELLTWVWNSERVL